MGIFPLFRARTNNFEVAFWSVAGMSDKLVLLIFMCIHIQGSELRHVVETCYSAPVWTEGPSLPGTPPSPAELERGILDQGQVRVWER